MSPSHSTKNIARIIISKQGMPSNLLGSWTQMLEYMFSQYDGNKMDYLLCGPSDLPFQSVATTRIICKSLKWEILRKWYYPIKYYSYIRALKSIIAKHEFVVVIVMDNPKLKNIVSETIQQNGWQHKCRIIFIQCGFSYEFTRDEYKDFKSGLHEIVLLTQKSYAYELNKYHEYPFLVHVLHNGMRQDIFYPLANAERQSKRQEIGIAVNEKMFLWVSHDRPKKGLDIILRMWPTVAAKYPGAKLIVVGAKRDISLPGLRFEGKLANTGLAKYYQSADVFLFSPLCQEGFGLSLAEAMSCGCFCIASDVGGVNEFFNENHGLLIQNPNQADGWIKAIDRYYEQPTPIGAGNQPIFLSYDEWCRRFQKIADDSIQFLIQSANR